MNNGPIGPTLAQRYNMSGPQDDASQAILGERAYQDVTWPEGKNILFSPGDTLLLLDIYVQKAKDAWAGENALEIDTLNVIRKITAIGFRALEVHAAPTREGF